VSIDQQFVEFVVKSLVSKPDEVQVKRTIDEKGVLLELTVDPEDLGRVIGKRGATAQSIRTLLRALGTKNDARYNLKIVDNGPGKPGRSEEKKSEGLWGEDSAEESSGSDKEAEEVITEAASTVEDEDTSVAAAASDEDEDEDDDENDSFSRTRKELADLDDLDV
jgi:predicted RNA-binding protein YlqC (UPF0109 family)